MGRERPDPLGVFRDQSTPWGMQDSVERSLGVYTDPLGCTGIVWGAD